MKVGVKVEKIAVAKPAMLFPVRVFPKKKAGIGIKATISKGEIIATFVRVIPLEKKVNTL
jgi:hypothetical protein